MEPHWMRASQKKTGLLVSEVCNHSVEKWWTQQVEGFQIWFFSTLGQSSTNKGQTIICAAFPLCFGDSAWLKKGMPLPLERGANWMRRFLAPAGVSFFLREAVDFSLIFRLILCSLVRIVSVLRRWMHSDYFDNALKQPPSLAFTSCDGWRAIGHICSRERLERLRPLFVCRNHVFS